MSFGAERLKTSPTKSALERLMVAPRLTPPIERGVVLVLELQRALTAADANDEAGLVDLEFDGGTRFLCGTERRRQGGDENAGCKANRLEGLLGARDTHGGYDLQVCG